MSIAYRCFVTQAPSSVAWAAACASPGPSPAIRAAPLPAPPVCDEGSSERLVLDWSPLDRSKLESAARRGVVAVKVSGCTARLVESCGAGRRYAYSPTSRQREVMLVRDKEELRAKLPLGAARFDASLERASALR